MKNTLQIIGGALAFILALDFFAFCAWILSGQTPVDGFYAGAITANILKLIIGA